MKRATLKDYPTLTLEVLADGEQLYRVNELLSNRINELHEKLYKSIKSDTLKYIDISEVREYNDLLHFARSLSLAITEQVEKFDAEDDNKGGD